MNRSSADPAGRRRGRREIGRFDSGARVCRWCSPAQRCRSIGDCQSFSIRRGSLCRSVGNRRADVVQEGEQVVVAEATCSCDVRRASLRAIGLLRATANAGPRFFVAHAQALSSPPGPTERILARHGRESTWHFRTERRHAPVELDPGVPRKKIKGGLAINDLETMSFIIELRHSWNLRPIIDRSYR
jgi:hypothetical protein